MHHHTTVTEQTKQLVNYHAFKTRRYVTIDTGEDVIQRNICMWNVCLMSLPSGESKALTSPQDNAWDCETEWSEGQTGEHLINSTEVEVLRKRNQTQIGIFTKGWNIKEFWIDSLILLSNQIRVRIFGGFWLMFAVWLCILYRTWDLYSDCRMTLVLQSFFSFSCCAVTFCHFVTLSCLTHKHTNTHYSHGVMEVFANTLWSRRCFLLFRAEADSSIRWSVYVSASFRPHESDTDICWCWFSLFVFRSLWHFVSILPKIK